MRHFVYIVAMQQCKRNKENAAQHLDKDQESGAEKYSTYRITHMFLTET